MRLDARSVLLGLVALGAIPEASCRVLYDYPQAYNVDPFYNVTEVVARAVVVPVKPIVPIKPKPPVAPGGDRSPGAVEPAAPAPLKPGGEGTPNSNPEPAPLKPAEKPDANKPDAEPLAPADKPDGTAADRDGAATGTKDKDGFFVDEPEIVCKRSIGLSKRSGTCSPWDTTRSNYRQRGRDIDAEIHGTRTHSTVDYASRLDDRTRYSRRREESPDAYPEDLVGSNGRGYDNEFGYPTERGEWDSHSVRSTHRRGNGNEYDEDLEPITVSSYGRGRRRNARPEDDEDAIGLMTHDIYGERDRVRFQQDSRNDVMRDSAGRPLSQPGGRDRYTPAAQQIHENYRSSNVYDRSDLGPRNYNMIQDNVANEGGSRLIRESLGDRHRASYRRESTGDEQDRYYEFMGSDNGRTMANVAARNPEYRRHRVHSFDIWDEPAPGMQLNLRRQDREGRW